MDCPLSKTEIDEFLTNLQDDKFVEEFEKQAQDKLSKPYEEMLLLSFKEFLQAVYTFEETDIQADLSSYTRDFIYEVCDDNIAIITLKVGNFEIRLKKPVSLADFKRIKNLVFTTNINEIDDIIVIQRALPDMLEIKYNGFISKDISKIAYKDAAPLLFIAPILFYIFLFYINGIGGTKKKKQV